MSTIGPASGAADPAREDDGAAAAGDAREGGVDAAAADLGLGAFVDRVVAANREAIRAAAEAIARTGRAGGLVRPAGAGHSLLPVVDAFYRAGGLAFVRPVWTPEILALSGARAATAAERRRGLGLRVAREAGIEARDTVVVWSNTGVSPYPVEIASHAREVGATVVAVTSPTAGAAAALRAERPLAEVADVVIDTLVPVGDVSWPPERPATAPLSGLANAAVWTAVLVAVDELDPEAPRWRSSHLPGSAEANAALFAAYEPRIPEL